MNDYFVRRSDILEFKRTLYRVRYGTDCQSIEDTEAVEVNDIESIPTADVRPMVRGEWIDMGDFEQCSACTATHLKEVQTVYGKMTWIKSDFCPSCGAKMVDAVE